MLQCLDKESRLIYVLGVMFKMDSKICGEILELTPEAYRQRLSRIRKKVADFLGEYCGLSKTGKCNCQKRVGLAIASHRLNPQNLEYSQSEQVDRIEFTQAMEELDELSLIYANMPRYSAPNEMKQFLHKLLTSDSLKTIMTGV